MMGAAIRVAGGGGNGGVVDTGAPAADADGFTAVLTAAASGKGSSGEAAAGTRTEMEAPVAEDTDAALAAALAALFPAAPAPQDQRFPADGDVDASLDDAVSQAGPAMAGRAGASTREGVQLPDPAAALPDASRDGAEGDAGNGLVERLARELAAARERAGSLRTGAGVPASAGGESPSTSAVPLASQLPAAAAAATATTAGAGDALRSPVGTPRWSEELGSRLVMMTTRGQHEGSLRLAPEDLGPLEVRISLQQSTAHVWFGAQHADTRAALAEALPRLREMFAEAGLSLGHAGVSQEAPGRRAGESAPAGGVAAADAAAPLEAEAPVRCHASGLIDLYA